jgi:hypothetical protein
MYGEPHDRGALVLTKQTITKKMDVPADQAWDAILGIGRLDAWFPSIATCVVDGEGVGAHRRMTLDGGLGDMTDRIVAIDSEKRTLTYNRIESPFPVSSYTGTVEVFTSFDSLAVVVWTVDFESEPEASAPVAEILAGAIGAGVDGMETDLRSRSV